MYVLGLGSALLAVSRVLLEWLVPMPDPRRLHGIDDGA
jgi:hypothetical protein